MAGIRRLDRQRVTSLATVCVVLFGSFLATPAHAEPAGPPPALPPAKVSTDLSVDQAAADARASGHPVEATSAASTTDTVLANPDGTVTLTRAATPNRTRVGGSWHTLDPTLEQNEDGSWSPKVSIGQLRLAPGGTNTIASMGGDGLAITIGAPMRLPAPTVSGATATYAAVMPGVDLQVTASATGGFSEVFVVRDAAAAANPELSTLALPIQADGVQVTTDAAGNIVGKDRLGQPVLTAPAPAMWDSTSPPGTTLSAPDGTKLEAVSHRPALSTSRGPGASARSAAVHAGIQSGRLELKPDKALLTGKFTKYPVYIDPTFTWSATGSANNGWATVAKDFANTNYWKTTPDPLGRMQVGNPGSIWSHTLINFPIATSVLAGANINTATLKMVETRSYSCNPSRLDLYAPGKTLTASNARWADWDGVDMGTPIGHQNIAHGYNDSCPADDVAFDVKNTITGLPSTKKTQTFVLTGDDEGNDTNSWKEFLQTSPTLTITYNHRPNKPVGMTTSPTTSCGADTPTVVGDGLVTLNAPVSDRDGGVLGVTFNLWGPAGSGTILASSNPNLLTYHSGTTAVLKVPVATLRAVAGTALTIFSWHVQVTDFNLTSDWSSTCRFTFDPTRPGQPDVPQPPDGTTTIGQSVLIPVNPPDDGTKPTSYLYQLNGGPYGTVTADANGAATITLIPTRFTNFVTVTGLSPGGNVGPSATTPFNSNPAATAADGDFTGDNIADLVTTGATHNLASGLWLSDGKNDGRLGPAAMNIGAHGNSIFQTDRPSDFDGAQIVTGRFAGSGLEDVLAYYPGGESAGAAVILRGNGDGTSTQSQLDGTTFPIVPGTLLDNQGNNPLQLANAGQPTGAAFPNLIGVAGDATGGYYLDYYPNMGEAGGYGMVNTLAAQTTPTGGLDWNTWTITGTQTASGTALFLWQQSTGKLYLWDGLTWDGDESISYTQHLLSTTWNAGQSLSLQAADIDSDGTADLWSVGASATAVGWFVTNLTADAGTLTGQPNQKVLTGTHAWLLNDAPKGSVTGENIARDSIGLLNATGSGNAAWNAGELFNPDLAVDGGSSTVATAGPAVATNADFTVSVWVKPAAVGGTVLSQDGQNIAGFKLWSETSDSSWRFALAAKDLTTTTWTTIAAPAGSVKVGVWTQLAASFKQSTGVMDLHVNGADVATGTQLTPVSADQSFRIGALRVSPTAIGGYFNGQIAEVLAFNQVVIYDDGNSALWDFSGDLKPDLIAAHTNGSLYMYRGNNAGGFKAGYGAIIGPNSWNTFSSLFSPGDFNGDGLNDIMGVKANGDLLLYRGNGLGSFIGSVITIGPGYQIYNTVFSPGDLNGDKKPDLIARRSDGALYYYRGNGAGGLNGPDSIGPGYQIYDTLFSPGDFNGDGRADMIARKPDGQLYLYRGNSAGGLLGPDKIGTNYNTYDKLSSPSDFTGDSKPDVIGRKPNGDLFLYRGNGAGGLIGPVQIGKSWDNFSTIF